MNVDDLAQLMGKSKEEVEAMLKNEDVIELKLTERKGKEKKSNEGTIKALD